LGRCQIPLAVVSDGSTAVVLDTPSGRKIGEGLKAIPAKADLLARLERLQFSDLPEERRAREELIFRTYDRERVNSARRVGER
jgi:hypothetical protein